MEKIVEAFGFNQSNYSVEKIENGLINHTWKLKSENKAFILQKINHHIFKNPGNIAKNISMIGNYLSKHSPSYLFISSIGAKSGKNYFQDTDGYFYRLMPFVMKSHTITTVENIHQAYEAARQFGKFSRQLSDFDTSKLFITLPDFHNLTLRFEQFKIAYKTASTDCLKSCEEYIRLAFKYQSIANQYSDIINKSNIPKRVIHHDTKISNVLFDKEDNGICVIDLDTVMPGYFFSDLGDMMRTYLCPVSEEEEDLSKINIRLDMFESIVKGYCSEMGDVLTPEEKSLFTYSGKFMIYMQAIRFLTDFLNGDTYYTTTYPGQNLIRAENQFCLLEKYIAQESILTEISASY
ncbi:aminoglycoside phosphotransferase [Pedobacter psychrophilus]|uniref:Aminoglycoside phosphotransferase n=1 Tax=Pedobacter psychrophilus TaxID=1826909 RepID=A0A179DIP5_9SPHI|nr:aminoglycoside phosphotransferase family protein [Pedobacter psychrophilus]OAQ40313.1 aminoglycoside phosphotransferase [Pedobacter psychrophilus]